MSLRSTYHIHPDAAINEEKGWWMAANQRGACFHATVAGGRLHLDIRAEKPSVWMALAGVRRQAALYRIELQQKRHTLERLFYDGHMAGFRTQYKSIERKVFQN